MPVVSEDAVKRDISSGNFAPGYLLFGDDAYLKKLYRNKISERASGGDPFFNLQRFEADCDLQAVYDAVMQYPMMADRKCVILDDYDFEHASKSDLDRLCTLLKDLSDTCVLILRFDSIVFDDRRSSKAKRLITAMEKGGGKVVRLDHRKTAELTKMLVDGAKKRGCRLESSSARLLIENVGNDINILQNELEKLCAYVHNGEITAQTVKNVCVKTLEASVYDLTGFIFSGNPAAALDILDGLFFMRFEPMIILYTVSAAYVDIYRMTAAKKSAITRTEAAADFGYRGREFVLERAANQSRRFDAGQLRTSFEILLETDGRLKTFGADPRTVLEEMVVRLCCVLVRGE